jgi:CBS domain-containing protein
MGGRDQLYTVGLDTPALDAIELMSEHNLEQVPVLEGNQLVGMLAQSDVMRQLQLRESLTAAR